MLTWLMDAAPSEEQSTYSLARRILGVNFAAIHTTSLTFTHALYQLAARPECVNALREEVESIVQVQGWTKDSMQKLDRVDSFLKESQRLSVLGSTVMPRRAVKDYTFSDGTFIPRGTFLSVPSTPMHRDNEYYEDARTFKPWRFFDVARASSSDGESQNTNHRMETTSNEYLPFAHGKHACPGRFLAAMVMKTLLAHIVLHYDVELETPGEIPPPMWFGTVLVPNRTGNVLFRKRG